MKFWDGSLDFDLKTPEEMVELNIVWDLRGVGHSLTSEDDGQTRSTDSDTGGRTMI